MPLFRRGSTDTRGGLNDRDLDEVISLVAARLGPGLVPDPSDLRDPDAAAKVDLPDVAVVRPAANALARVRRRVLLGQPGVDPARARP